MKSLKFLILVLLNKYYFLVVFLENEILYDVSFPMSSEAMSPDFVIPIGKAKIERTGSDVTLVAYSMGVQHALKAAEVLEQEGISAEV